MRSLLQRLAPLLIAVALIEAVLIAAPRILRGGVRHVETSEALLGKAVALRAGCFGCHGDGGHGHVPNLGSKAEEAPGYRGGILMMYANSDEEIRDWILNGAPARFREDKDWQEMRKNDPLRMPAYRGKLTDREIVQLVTYIKAVASRFAPEDGAPEAAGLETASRAGCFGCHGDAGMGGVGNAGSFKGYIPGFWGDDFHELVTSDAELREWIEKGISQRFKEDKLARRFLEGQAITMPAFKDRLPPQEIDRLVAYVRWVNGKHSE